MKMERVIEAAHACAEMLTDHAELMRDILEFDGGGPIVAKRLDEKSMRHRSTGLGAGVSHMLFMCKEIERMANAAIDESHAAAIATAFRGADECPDEAWERYAAKREKAMRWLGFIQGSLWSWNIASVDQLRRMNMPAEETEQAERDGAA